MPRPRTVSDWRDKWRETWRERGGVLLLSGAVLLVIMVSLAMRRVIGAPSDRKSAGEDALALATESARSLLMVIA